GAVRKVLERTAGPLPFALCVSWPVPSRRGPLERAAAACGRPTRRRAPRAASAAQFPQVRVRRVGNRLRVALARTCAASRPADAAARLDVLAVCRAPFRDRESLADGRGRVRLDDEFRRSQSLPAATVEAHPRQRGFGYCD